MKITESANRCSHLTELKLEISFKNRQSEVYRYFVWEKNIMKMMYSTIDVKMR